MDSTDLPNAKSGLDMVYDANVRTSNISLLIYCAGRYIFRIVRLMIGLRGEIEQSGFMDRNCGIRLESKLKLLMPRYTFFSFSPAVFGVTDLEISSSLRVLR